MLPDNIDDLFRQKLDGHATPPAPDLWARLQLPAPDAALVDTTFQAGLRGHTTPPRRALWERLEDEHLRPQPRRRRVVAWWQLSAAAVLLLGLLLGGGLLWRGSHLGSTGSEVARLGAGSSRRPTSQPTASATAPANTVPTTPATRPLDLATAATPPSATPKKNQDFFPTQATASQASTSSTPIATTTQPRRTATAHRASGGAHPSSPPDAVAGTLASHGGRNIPGSQAPTTSPNAPNSATHPDDAPTLAAATPAAAPEVIEVEVRRGAAQPAPVAAVVADAAPAPARRRGLRLGGLLRQADHLVHGEPVSLAEATTGSAETLTVQGRLGGRTIFKTIQL